VLLSGDQINTSASVVCDEPFHGKQIFVSCDVCEILQHFLCLQMSKTGQEICIASGKSSRDSRAKRTRIVRRQSDHRDLYIQSMRLREKFLLKTKLIFPHCTINIAETVHLYGQFYHLVGGLTRESR
jgi:hypothetical protein